ncbi:hypothetical protein Nepgr_021051 [Nepenthes gracilis]|uniref:Uncharacterized protein n=1 Tax=Nepenthes gracilis TaxID=150966 RepID=A0AAD3SY00_NEPGR|nr:hypothetical protein Nepgr_021051 [Nepenthes gracilis]
MGVDAFWCTVVVVIISFASAGITPGCVMLLVLLCYAADLLGVNGFQIPRAAVGLANAGDVPVDDGALSGSMNDEPANVVTNTDHPVLDVGAPFVADHAAGSPHRPLTSTGVDGVAISDEFGLIPGVDGSTPESIARIARKYSLVDVVDGLLNKAPSDCPIKGSEASVAEAVQPCDLGRGLVHALPNVDPCAGDPLAHAFPSFSDFFVGPSSGNVAAVQGLSPCNPSSVDPAGLANRSIPSPVPVTGCSVWHLSENADNADNVASFCCLLHLTAADFWSECCKCDADTLVAEWWCAAVSLGWFSFRATNVFWPEIPFGRSGVMQKMGCLLTWFLWAEWILRSKAPNTVGGRSWLVRGNIGVNLTSRERNGESEYWGTRMALAVRSGTFVLIKPDAKMGVSGTDSYSAKVLWVSELFGPAKRAVAADWGIMLVLLGQIDVGGVVWGWKLRWIDLSRKLCWLGGSRFVAETLDSDASSGPSYRGRAPIVRGLAVGSVTPLQLAILLVLPERFLCEHLVIAIGLWLRGPISL